MSLTLGKIETRSSSLHDIECFAIYHNTNYQVLVIRFDMYYDDEIQQDINKI